MTGDVPAPVAADTPDFGDRNFFVFSEPWEEVEFLEGQVEELFVLIDELIEVARRIAQCAGHELSCSCEVHAVLRRASEARG